MSDWGDPRYHEWNRERQPFPYEGNAYANYGFINPNEFANQDDYYTATSIAYDQMRHQFVESDGLAHGAEEDDDDDYYQPLIDTAYLVAADDKSRSPSVADQARYERFLQIYTARPWGSGPRIVESKPEPVKVPEAVPAGVRGFLTRLFNR